jgi:hypothetical protein
LEKLFGKEIPVALDGWRPRDQLKSEVDGCNRPLRF